MGLTEKLLVALLFGAGLFAGGYSLGHRHATNDAKAERLAAVSHAIEQANLVAEEDQAIAAGAEIRREIIRTVYRTIRQEAIDHVQTHPALAECGLDADGLHLYNAHPGDPAFSAAQPDGAMSGSAAGAGRALVHDPAQQPGSGGAVLRLPGAAPGAGGLGIGKP